MPLRDALERVLTEYRDARTTFYTGHPLASFIRREFRQEVESSLGEVGAGLIVEGSAGAGNWAMVPWIAVFDPTVTNTATRGYYVCYLFHATEPVVHLSLNQGTTQTREEFGPRAREILSDRAEFIRRRLNDFGTLLPASEIDLGSSARLPGDYTAGHALGATYRGGQIPSDTELRADLQNAIRAYLALTFRGRLDPEIGGEITDDFPAALMPPLLRSGATRHTSALSELPLHPA